MSTQNQYVPQLVELRGGLDFTTPKLSVDPGVLQDCYNFEVTDRLGYARIMGNERFDGSYAPSSTYTNSIVLIHDSVTYGGSLPNARSPLYISGATKPFGFLIQRGATSSVVSITDFVQADPLIVFLQNPFGSIEITSPDGPESWDVINFSNNSLQDAQLTTALRNDQFNNVSAFVDTIDSDAFQSPVIGLRWYKDQLYAIRNLNVYAFEDGVTEVFPNETLVDTSTGLIEMKILEVNVTSGSWSAGDASGTIVTYSDELVNGQMDLVERKLANVLDISIVQPSPAELIDTVTSAGIWRSYSREQADIASLTPGWHPVDMGFQLSFTGGTQNGPPLVYARGEVDSVTSPIAAASAPTSAVTSGAVVWTLGGGAGSTLDAVQTDDQEYVQAQTAAVNPATILQVSGFSSASSVPVGAKVSGISLKLSVAGPTGSAKTPYFLTRPISLTGELGSAKSTPSVRKVAGAFTADDIYVLGGQSDTWGIENLQAELANGFGFNIVPRAQGSGGGNIDYRVNFVELTVYYTATTQTMYFWNGSDDVQAEITNFSVDEGDWTTDDAHGYMQLYNLTAVSPGTRIYLQAGDQIRTLPGGGGNLIATVETDASGTVLPGLSQIELNDSRYQMTVANFYGNEDWEAIYGVSGAGRAFSYDGFYLRWIYTGLPDDIDKPRHVVFFQHHLGIGYKAGNLSMSVLGEPENFSGELGASSWDVGDPVTGLVRMNGSTLGIACRDSINSLTGSSLDDFSVRCINPYEGAIEYTVTDIGKPIYCSYKGISLFEQTAAYGDYLGVRLSAAITSWLVPRLQGRVPPLDIFVTPDDPTTKPREPVFLRQTTSVGPLMAYPVRSKNQYRLVFEDGSILTMTLMGPEGTPVFTFQAVIVHRNDGISFVAPYSNFIPRAECSAVDSLGRERIHLAHYNAQRDAPNSDNPWFVYEFERSWTFDGRGIPAYFVTTSNFKNAPFQFNSIEKVRAHGLSFGYAPCKLLVTKDYEGKDPSYVDVTELQDISLPKPPAALLSADFLPYTSIVSYPKTGWAIAMTFASYTGINPSDGPFGFKLAPPSPPFAYQTLLLQYSPSRGDL